ncbi:hypothetical protein O6H91_11G102400 [Diphasiastrum complanatum]|uniref:Uncharacterized protein n=1 Tax=Diphasiastrum complanatum TaxID=34168 RepID=A0ACC2CCA3_DIPCM|nr:hypothetical protein O6H91_Y335900 [Diphasiastrum complanatum]KAJ7539629.1 hypothetical protein O6H91_11G102400 [Diphasiastrum complanatum]
MNLGITLLGCLLFIFAPSIVSQTISLGSTLTPTGNLWVSPGNAFALGFYNLGQGIYSVGVFYHKQISTVVWTAGRNLTVTKDAILELGQDGNLVLYNSSSKAVTVWESKTSGQNVVGADMNDTGNFVLVNSSSQFVWQSFQYPTDTLVPGQQLMTGTNLSTVQADSSISTYTLTLETNGNLSLYWKNDLSYWGSDTSSAYSNLSVSGNSPKLGLSLDSNGRLQLVANSSVLANWLSSDYGPNPLRRLTLDADGNLRIYSWAAESGSWIVMWQAVENQCDVYGWCGSYGLCTYNIGAPICNCPAGFKPLDSQQPTKGCKFIDADIATCGGGSQVVSLNHTVLFAYESDNFLVSDNDEGCKSGCLKDPTCVAAIVPNDGAGKCRQKRSHFISGYQFPFLQATSYLKVCNLPTGPATPGVSECSPAPKSSKGSRIGIVIGTTCTFAVTILLEVCVWGFCCRRRITFRGPLSNYAVLDFASGAPIKFTYRELQSATKNFSNKLGEGGFGAVYKGTLLNKTTVAVKKLEGIQQGEKEFRMEVAIIGSTHHINLVHLVGFCSEGSHRLLVYDYMANLSLDRYLFSDSELTKPLLNWKTRFNIALGTARAIAYLHEECRDCIIHCDIKPENILLDEHLSAKVSDFGLAKLLKEGHGRTQTTVRGTRGYLAPEWLTDLPITTKSDVFSFGMVLLEIISGRRNYDPSMDSDKSKFPTWAFHQFEAGQIMSIVDERLHGELESNQLERAVQVSFWCIQDQASHRPSMSKVVQMLEGNILLGEPPMPKSFDEIHSRHVQQQPPTASGLSSFSVECF